MTTHLPHRIRTGAAIAAIAGTTAAVLCASASAVGATGAASPPPCRTPDLTAQIEPLSPGAGQRYARLELINHTSHSCHTYGHVGMLFLDGHGRPVPTHVIWDPNPKPQVVVLAPGAAASSLLHWSAVPGNGDSSGPCVTPPRQVEITPPDEYTQLVLPWKGGVVCERGWIDVTALVHAQ